MYASICITACSRFSLISSAAAVGVAARISETKKDRDPSNQTTSGVGESIIMPGVAKSAKIKKPRKKKLPNNTKAYKAMRVKQPMDGEASVFKVYTPDGEFVYIQKQATGEYSQVKKIGNTDRYGAVAGAKGYERLPQAVAGLKQDYTDSKKAAEVEAAEVKPSKKIYR